jgi:hypothetical protein
MCRLLFVFILLFPSFVGAQYTYQIAVLKYHGGGDYNANPTSLPNLITFCNTNLKMKINPEVPYVDVGSKEIFQHPFIHMTGHGNVVFSNTELDNLRTYLQGGGFLHIDDNYGMDTYIRSQLKNLFPTSDLLELPFNHPVFHQKYDFNGLPKIHEHDDKAPKAYGIILEGKLVCLYTYETDLGDGWEDADVHNDPKEVREKALKMGANILNYIFSN